MMTGSRACPSVGIDLGTTYSSIAYVDAQLLPRIVCDSSGQAVIPSVVYFDDAEILVGELALSQARLNAERTVQFIKAQMGERWRKTFHDHEHTPESISALILGQLIREAEPQIGPIPSAVITVPAYFTERRRRATQQAGEIAGLQVVGTLNEPMAAMLAYGLHRTGVDENVVVYDLGGGTFDVTIVHVGPGRLVELATNGNRQLGGRDWDSALIDFVSQDFLRHHGRDPRDDSQVRQDLQMECERAKRRLRMPRTTIRVQAFGRDHQVEISRPQFESLTAHLLQSTKLTTEIALEDAKLTWDDIGRVVLIGGSTHMPGVRTMLQSASGRPPDTGVNPVTAVALGAAIYAHMLECGQPIETVSALPEIILDAEEVDDLPPSGTAAAAVILGPAETNRPEDAPAPRIRFVTAHGVGVKVMDQDKTWKNEVLIPKNTAVPAEVTRRFRTTGKAAAEGKIPIVITQGDTDDLALTELLGTGFISGLPKGEPPGYPVDVTMGFDDQGRLKVGALYVKTGQAMQMDVEVHGALRGDEIEKLHAYLDERGLLSTFDAREALDRLRDDEA